MFNKLICTLALAFVLAAGAQAHEGHEDAGVFEPPHGGAFTRLSGHWVEFYLKDGQAFLCMYESDGKLTVDEHAPKQIQVKLSGKGVKATTFKAAASKEGCASWPFKTKARLLRVEVQALVEGKLAKAKLNLENKAK